MGRCVRGIRGLGIASVVLGGVLFCTFAVSLVTAAGAYAQTASQIVVEGNDDGMACGADAASSRPSLWTQARSAG